jgi:vacuolar-type H+-ATPase subunit E/Vma4
MAIGWGKSYEEQMEEANQRASDARRQRQPRLPEEDRTRLQRLESLKLSRSRVLAQLERASLPAHRQMLMKALQALEKETDELSQPADEDA